MSFEESLVGYKEKCHIDELNEKICNEIDLFKEACRTRARDGYNNIAYCTKLWFDKGVVYGYDIYVYHETGTLWKRECVSIDDKKTLQVLLEKELKAQNFSNATVELLQCYQNRMETYKVGVLKKEKSISVTRLIAERFCIKTHW